MICPLPAAPESSPAPGEEKASGPRPLLTLQPAEEGISLQQGPVAQGTGDNGLIALEVVHGTCVELPICRGEQ